MKTLLYKLSALLIAAIVGALLLFAWQKAPTPAPEDASHAAHTASYTCPMHPQIIRDQPGTCPICGMDLVPVKDHDGPRADSTLPQDAIHIDPAMVLNLGVKTITLETGPLVKTLQITGGIAIDPQRVSVVNARTMGWIESVSVGAEGLRVATGQQLATFYSPDLVAAQEDYLQALSLRDSLLVASSRQRLEVLGLSPVWIDSLRAQGKSQRTVPLFSPRAGVVIAQSITQGQNVMPGTDLYRIADLSRVWAVGTVYPADIGLLRTGMEAEVILSGQSSGRSGRILFISPLADPQTKTTEVRIEISNSPELAYKPGLNTELRFRIPLGEGIAIPAQAVIHSGDQTIAIVALGEGTFAPREVGLGARVGDSVQVLQGLAAGETIVTSAQFLIDSESNLKKAVQAFHTGH